MRKVKGSGSHGSRDCTGAWMDLTGLLFSCYLEIGGLVDMLGKDSSCVRYEGFVHLSRMCHR